jgi:hypothetical protein
LPGVTWPACAVTPSKLVEGGKTPCRGVPVHRLPRSAPRINPQGRPPVPALLSPGGLLVVRDMSNPSMAREPMRSGGPAPSSHQLSRGSPTWAVMRLKVRQGDEGLKGDPMGSFEAEGVPVSALTVGEEVTPEAARRCSSRSAPWGWQRRARHGSDHVCRGSKRSPGAG